MKKLLYMMILFAGLAISCEKDYLIDGGTHKAEVNMSTVDYLKANAQQRFRMTLMIYEKAGMLDLLNTKGATVFIPSDYALNRYAIQLRDELRRLHNDDNYPFNLDSLVNHIDEYKDSLKMYIVPESINRGDVGNGKQAKSLLGNDMFIYLSQSKLYTGDSEQVPPLPNSKPWFLYYRRIINGLDPTDKELNSNDPNKDVSDVCQTSGIITTTGILHALDDDHNLFFSKRNKPGAQESPILK